MADNARVLLTEFIQLQYSIAHPKIIVLCRVAGIPKPIPTSWAEGRQTPSTEDQSIQGSIDTDTYIQFSIPNSACLWIWGKLDHPKETQTNIQHTKERSIGSGTQT